MTSVAAFLTEEIKEGQIRDSDDGASFLIDSVLNDIS